MRIVMLLLISLFFYLTASSQCNLDSVVINSILPDPNGINFFFDTDGNGTYDNEDEYIELCNTGAFAVDVSGWQLGDDDGVFPNFTFPPGTILPPAQCFLIVAKWQNPNTTVPFNTFEVGSTAWMDNDGDLIVLFNPDSGETCSIVYNGAICEVDGIEGLPMGTIIDCQDWTQDIDGCPLLMEGDSCDYVPVLPVEILYFNVEKKDDQALLEWATAVEINNEFFVIQRSDDAIKFDDIATLDGAGDTNYKVYYEYVDNHLKTGSNYYRLKQIDYDGNVNFSEIRAINKKRSAEKPLVYPTIVQSQLFIDINEENSFSIEILDIKAQLKLYDENTSSINLSNLAAGPYLVRIISDQDIFVYRIIKE